MNTPLRQTSTYIGRSVAAIEGAFLQAGDGLSRGLETFDRLNSLMAHLATSMAGGPLEKAASALDGLAADLIDISRQIPADLKTLEALVADNEAIAKRLDRLLDHIRMMTVVSRSARIEAVVFDEALGLRNFTDEINKLASHVKDEIAECAQLHAQMFDLLRGAANEQSGLDRAYRDKLAALAADLQRTFVTIRQRREKSAGFVEDLTAHSSRIGQATGLALVSLQGGDSIRQRLEHVGEAVARVVELQAGEGGEEPSVPDVARAATATVLCRLQEVQLSDAVEAFADEANSIESTLDLLIDDTGTLLAKSKSIFGDMGEGNDSFVASFHARLTSAAEFINTCEASRASVARVISDLRTMLTAFQRTIATLNDTTLGIVLVGVNAGLKAVRLGASGRSLAVIADELKLLANEIAKDADALLPMFTQVQDQCDRLGDGAGENPDQARSVDGTIATLVDDLALGKRTMDTALTSLRQDGESFDAELRRARSAFAAVVAMNADLVAAAQAMGDMARADTAPEHPLAVGLADAIMAKRYTMSRERDLHAAVLERPIAC